MMQILADNLFLSLIYMQKQLLVYLSAIIYITLFENLSIPAVFNNLGLHINVSGNSDAWRYGIFDGSI